MTDWQFHADLFKIDAPDLTSVPIPAFDLGRHCRDGIWRAMEAILGGNGEAMSQEIADLFAKHVNRESFPVITYDRFMEMLAEHGLSIHPFFVPPRGNLCFSIGKDDRLVEQYSSEIFPCYFTEKLMEEELDKLAHPDYDRKIHGIRSKSDE